MDVYHTQLLDNSILQYSYTTLLGTTSTRTPCILEMRYAELGHISYCQERQVRTMQNLVSRLFQPNHRVTDITARLMVIVILQSIFVIDDSPTSWQVGSLPRLPSLGVVVAW